MGDGLQVGKPSRYVASHPGQLSLAIPPWVGAMSTGESWDVNSHTARCTSPVSVVWQCKLVSGWGLRKRRSAPPYGPCGSGRTLQFLHSSSVSSSLVLCQCKRDNDRLQHATVSSTKYDTTSKGGEGRGGILIYSIGVYWRTQLS